MLLDNIACKQEKGRAALVKVNEEQRCCMLVLPNQKTSDDDRFASPCWRSPTMHAGTGETGGCPASIRAGKVWLAC